MENHQKMSIHRLKLQSIAHTVIHYMALDKCPPPEDLDEIKESDPDSAEIKMGIRTIGFHKPKDMIIEALNLYKGFSADDLVVHMKVDIENLY